MDMNAPSLFVCLFVCLCVVSTAPPGGLLPPLLWVWVKKAGFGAQPTEPPWPSRNTSSTMWRKKGTLRESLACLVFLVTLIDAYRCKYVSLFALAVQIGALRGEIIHPDCLFQSIYPSVSHFGNEFSVWLGPSWRFTALLQEFCHF